MDMVRAMMSLGLRALYEIMRRVKETFKLSEKKSSWTAKEVRFPRSGWAHAGEIKLENDFVSSRNSRSKAVLAGSNSYNTVILTLTIFCTNISVCYRKTALSGFRANKISYVNANEKYLTEEVPLRIVPWNSAAEIETEVTWTSESKSTAITILLVFDNQILYSFIFDNCYHDEWTCKMFTENVYEETTNRSH